jgi:inorganic phosphate transporter, PiT family
VTAQLAVALGLALAFAVTNGLHDAANAVAALVATRAGRPGPAIAVAAVFNLLGPLLLGAAVADTIGGIVTVSGAEAVAVIGAGLAAAVAWNLATWWRGLPASSGHALVGGLVGAGLAQGGTAAVLWGGLDGARPVGVFGVLIALAVSPLLGAAGGALVVAGLRGAGRRATHRWLRPVRAAQWGMTGALSFSHGANDAQKSVGVIAALLVATGHLQTLHSPAWAALLCAAALTAGTALGGWRIVRTVGRRIFRLHPLDGLASQSASAGVIFGASLLGAPTSTTQVVASSVVGVGAGHGRLHHVRWPIVRAMALAWLVTLPVCAALGAASLVLWKGIT